MVCQPGLRVEGKTGAMPQRSRTVEMNPNECSEDGVECQQSERALEGRCYGPVEMSPLQPDRNVTSWELGAPTTMRSLCGRRDGDESTRAGPCCRRHWLGLTLEAHVPQGWAAARLPSGSNRLCDKYGHMCTFSHAGFCRLDMLPRISRYQSESGIPRSVRHDGLASNLQICLLM
jgi:hypothetical protein